MAGCMPAGDKGYIVAPLVGGILPSKVTATDPADKKASPGQASLSTAPGPHADIKTIFIYKKYPVFILIVHCINLVITRND